LKKLSSKITHLKAIMEGRKKGNSVGRSEMQQNDTIKKAKRFSILGNRCARQESGKEKLH